MSSKPKQITLFNTNDDRFALVNWVNSTKKYEEFNVESMNSVEVLPPGETEYKLGEIYRVLFHGAKYRAKLIFIECLKMESEVLAMHNDQDSSLQSKIAKSNPPKVANNLANQNREQCRIIFLETQVEDMSKLITKKDTQINELESLLKEKDASISKLKDSLENLTQQASRIVDKHAIDKLLHVASEIFSNFGTKSDLENIVLSNIAEDGPQTVLISANYDFRMPIQLKMHLKRMSDDQETSSTVIYRDMVKTLINDPYKLGNGNAATLQKDYPIVLACRDYVSKLRSNFTKELMCRCFRELSCEARQAVWKNDKDYVFKYNEKEYRKPTETDSPNTPAASTTNISKGKRKVDQNQTTDKAKKVLNYDTIEVL